MCAALVLGGLASCRSAAKTDGSSPAEPAQPLAVYAAQRLVLTPAGFVRADSLGWVQRFGGARAVARKLDTSIVAALEERGLGRRWFLPPDLVRAFERNRTYATDPYQLALEPVRSSKFVTAERFGEPLSSQLRTMIALHEEARFVLVPIELRIETVGAAARGVLKVALMDPRFAQATWVGEVKGDAAGTAARTLASVASRLADLFTEP